MRTGQGRALTISALMLLLAGGCATSRGILDVRVSDSQNPASGPAVAIARVTDKRVFEENPRDPSIPSLKGSEIGDRSLTARAIARKRNTYGKALGDILLPEGRTVEDVVREALVKSFREAGYRVVDGSAGSDGAVVPVEADIDQFWSWLVPGFWAVSMKFEATVVLKGNIPALQNGETVRSSVELHAQVADTRAWLNTVHKGMDMLVSEVSKRLTKQ